MRFLFWIGFRSQSKSHFFSPEKSPEKSFVVILTTDHLIGWYLILPNRRVTPLTLLRKRILARFFPIS